MSNIIQGKVDVTITIPVGYKAMVGAGGQVNMIDQWIASDCYASLSGLPVEARLQIIEGINVDARERDSDQREGI